MHYSVQINSATGWVEFRKTDLLDGGALVDSLTESMPNTSVRLVGVRSGVTLYARYR